MSERPRAVRSLLPFRLTILDSLALTLCVAIALVKWTVGLQPEQLFALAGLMVLAAVAGLSKVGGG